MKIKQFFFLIAIFALQVPLAQAIEVPGPLVNTDWLSKNQDKVTILDLRADVRSFTSKPAFKTNKKTGKKRLVAVGGHIPGAKLVNYKDIRTTVEIKGKKVLKMLPDKTMFEKVMQKAGLSKDSAIVIVTKGVGNGDMTMAARLYWQLKYYGQDNMAILNGGMAQWIIDGRKSAFDYSKPAAGNWLATDERKHMLATTEDVEKAVKDKSVQLVDNRSIDLYLGTWKKSYVYDKGHIPGAKVWPNSVLTTHGAPAKYMPEDELRALSKGLGIDAGKPTITYCNSGHLASGGWFVMHELLGNEKTKLYDGSMHEWTLRKEPVKALVME